jgi:type III secretion protein L
MQNESDGSILSRDGKILRRHQAGCYFDAEKTLSDAKAEAARMIQAAQDDIEQQRRAAYESGLREGRREQAFIVAETLAQRDVYLVNAEQEVCDLLLAAIRTIFAEFDDTEKTRMVVRKALSALRAQTQVLIRVHPNQYGSIRQQLAQMAAALPGLPMLEVKPDGTIAEAACIVSSELGTIETSIQEQIEALEAAFTQAMAKEPAANVGPSSVERAVAETANDGFD